MDKPRRYSYIKNKGFKISDDGNYISYKNHLLIINKLLREQLDIPRVSKPLPTKRKPTFKVWLEEFKYGAFGNYYYKEAWCNKQAMQSYYNDLE